MDRTRALRLRFPSTGQDAPRTCDGHEQAALSLFERIEAFCDRLRIRSTLDWLSRAEFEGKHARRPLEGGMEPVDENG